MNYRKVFLSAVLFLAVSLTNVLLAQNIDFPVGVQSSGSGTSGTELYSGSKTITIPIWNCEYTGFSIPIQLTYATTGIKVDQVASWVGLGWGLKAGGAITRVVKCFPDDKKYEDGYPYYEKKQIGWLFLNHPNTTTITIGQEIQNFDTIDNDEAIRSSEINYFTGQWQNDYKRKDAEPDIFYIDACGLHGSFVFDGSGTPRFIGTSNYKILTIRATDGSISGFRITDESGNKYFFIETEGVAESNTLGSKMVACNWTYNAVPSLQAYTSKWYLSKIVTYYNEVIKFSYALEKFIPDELPYNVAVGGPDQIETSTLINQWEEAAIVDSKRLTSITSENDSVVFVANNIRTDIHNIDVNKCKSLDKIFIYSYLENGKSNPVLKKEFDFGYTYFQSNGYQSVYNDNNKKYNCDTKRLKLISLQEIGHTDNNQTILPPYQFFYNESITLPRRFSFAQDFWGFYNGQDNTTMIPTIYVYPDINKGGSYRFRLYTVNGAQPTWCYQLVGANRSPNITYIKAWTLTKIKMPTGGNQQFEYESNTFSDTITLSNQSYRTDTIGGGLRLKGMKMTDSLDYTKDIIESYTYHNGKAIVLPIYGYFDPDKWIGYNQCNVNGSSYFDYFNHTYFRTTTDLADQSEGCIGYDSVTVTKLNAHNNQTLGKTVYHFLNEGTYGTLSSNDGVFQKQRTFWCRDSLDIINNKCAMTDEAYMFFAQAAYPYPPNTNYDWARGIPIEVNVYNDGMNLVSHTKYKYKTFCTNNIPFKVYGLKMGFLKNNSNYYVNPPSDPACNNVCGTGGGSALTKPLVVLSKYYIETGVSKLLDTVITTNYGFNYSHGLPQKTIYTYNTIGQLKKIVFKGDDNVEHIRTFTNLADMGLPISHSNNLNGDEPSLALISMLDSNNISTPIETVELIKKPTDPYEGVISSSLGLPKKFTNSNNTCTIALPEKSYALYFGGLLSNTGSNLSTSFGPSHVELSNGQYILIKNDNYILKSVIDQYNDQWKVSKYHSNNDIASSSIWSYNGTYETCTVVNANPEEIAYESFEKNNECDWTNYNAQINSDAHTGHSSYYGDQVNCLSKLFYPDTQKPIASFKASVWAKGASTGYIHIQVQNNGPGHTTYNTAGSTNQWNLLEVELPVSEVQFAITHSIPIYVELGTTNPASSVLLDDIRVLPSDARMTTSTYNPFVGKTSQTDINNRTVWYETDGLGRLLITRDLDKNIIFKHEYHLVEH